MSKQMNMILIELNELNRLAYKSLILCYRNHHIVKPKTVTPAINPTHILYKY